MPTDPGAMGGTEVDVVGVALVMRVIDVTDGELKTMRELLRCWSEVLG